MMADDQSNILACLTQSADAMSISYLMTLTGFVYAWPSYTVLNFRSNNTVLSSPMTTLQISLMCSLPNIGALVVTPMCGYIVDKLGRKYSAILFGVPFVITWGIISVTTSVPLVITAMGVAGVGAAGQPVLSVYIGEICQESCRGALTSTTVSAYFVGLLFSYILGGYLTYYQVVYIHLLLSVLYIALLLLLKESPVFLMQIGKEEEAAKSIAFYRRVDVTSRVVAMEIANIKLQLNPKINQILESDGGEHTATTALVEISSPIEARKYSVWTFLKKSKSSRRALFAVITVMALTTLMGSIALQMYAELFFQQAVPTMSANTCSIILASVYLTAVLICASMLDKYGRKFLLTTTSTGTGFFCVLIGTQLQFHWAPHWFTAFCIYGYSFFYNMGASAIPFVLAAEVFLPDIRAFGNSVSIAVMWISNFVTLAIFNLFEQSIGLGPLFYEFSIVCFITAIYSHYGLPETKELTVNAIQLAFLGKQDERASTS